MRNLQALANLSYQAGFGTLDLRANPVVSLWPLAESNVTDILAEQTVRCCAVILKNLFGGHREERNKFHVTYLMLAMKMMTKGLISTMPSPSISMSLLMRTLMT